MTRASEAITNNLQDKVCPKCGDFVDILLEKTGWCKSCSGQAAKATTQTQTEGRLCQRCEETFTDGIHKFCRRCRTDRWLEKHADQIERYLAEGISKREAFFRTRTSDYLKCVLCCSQMKPSASGGRLFCNKEKCRKAYHRFNYLMYKRRFTREDALEQILQEQGRSQNGRSNSGGRVLAGRAGSGTGQRAHLQRSD